VAKGASMRAGSGDWGARNGDLVILGKKLGKKLQKIG